jgi:hypothetical protein
VEVANSAMTVRGTWAATEVAMSASNAMTLANVSTRFMFSSE